MNKKDTYQQGYETGYDIANENIDDLLSYDDPLSESAIDNFTSEMCEHESEVFRQFSPFEFFANDINNCYNSESLWDGYDNGVYKGILTRVKEFKRDYKKGNYTIKINRFGIITK